MFLFYLSLFFHSCNVNIIFDLHYLNFFSNFLLLDSLILLVIILGYISKSKKYKEFDLLIIFQKYGLIIFCLYYVTIFIFIVIMTYHVIITMNILKIIDILSIGFLIKNPILNIKTYLNDISKFDFSLQNKLSCFLNIFVINIIIIKNNNYINCLNCNLKESLFYVIWLFGFLIFFFNIFFIFKNIKFIVNDKIQNKLNYFENLFDSFFTFLIFIIIILIRFFYKSNSLNIQGYLINDYISLNIEFFKIFLIILMLFNFFIIIYLYYVKKNYKKDQTIFINKHMFILLFIFYIFLILISLIILRPIIYDLFQITNIEESLFFYEKLKIKLNYII